MSDNPYLLSFFGDDFTGSTDVMETLALQGIPTALFLKAPSQDELKNFQLKRGVGGDKLQAFGVPGITRSLAPAQMSIELESALDKISKIPSDFFQYKICSTLDSSPKLGNIGVATDVALKYFPSSRVPVVVGAPFLNRFVAFGNLFARLKNKTYRIDRHPVMAVHPSTPMSEGDIGLHLAKQTDREYQNIDVLHFDSLDRLKQAFGQTSENKFIIFDTLDNTHLVQIARLLVQHHPGQTQLLIGSSGISYGLGHIYGDPNHDHSSGFPAEQILVVSGSCSPVSESQIQAFATAGAKAISLDVIRLLSNPEARYDQILANIGQSLRANKSVILHSALGPNDPMIAQVKSILAENERTQIGSHLGEITKRILREFGKIRTVVVGGDTSGQVARALGIYALETAWPVAPGAPLCVAHSSEPLFDGLEIALKGGQNGKEDYFLKVLSGSIS